MSSPPRTITCTCCGRRGPSHSRRLIIPCYHRHHRAGTLHQYPRVTGISAPWQPTGPHGRRMLDRYRELAAIRPPLSTARMAFELGVTKRSVERYAAAIRAAEQQATTDTDQARSEAAA